MLPNRQAASTSSDSDLRRIVVVSSDSNSSISSSTIFLPDLRLPGDDLRWKLDVIGYKDLELVKRICLNSFPLVYPETWFEEVVAGKFISFGVYHGDTLTSLLVAEIKKLSECDKEDRDLDRDQNTLVCYILSLAVDGAYRRRGIGCILLDHLFKAYVYAAPHPKLVFLHVLHTNHGAIDFYRNYGFDHHSTLQDYYVINEKYEAGCTFVLRATRPSAQNSIRGFFSFIFREARRKDKFAIFHKN